MGKAALPALILGCLLGGGAAIPAQPQRSLTQPAAAATPKFEVASIRPGCPGAESNHGPPASWIDHPSPGRLSFCAILSNLIDMAYSRYAGGHVNPSPVPIPLSGDPPWITSDKYMLNAKAEGNPAQAIMRGPMLQALLEDRFKLKVHLETRQVPVYVLTVAKGGPKLQRFKEGSCIPFNFANAENKFVPGRSCSNRMDRKGPNQIVNWHGITLEDFAKTVLFSAVGRPVIDKTGITGVYDFHLEFAPDQGTAAVPAGGALANGPAASADEPAGASIFTAIREQLGLKLEPGRGPREFLVIDHVERPSEN